VPAVYDQTKDESVALLKLVIAQVSQHDAPCNPVTFAVWYEHFAKVNPRLSAALDESLRSTPRLSGQMIARLHAEHVAEPDAQSTAAVGDAFQRVMRGMAESATDTRAGAAVYGSQLAGLNEALQAQLTAPSAGSPDSDPIAALTSARALALEPHLQEVSVGTTHMQSLMAGLQGRVASALKEIEQLRQDLARSRAEAVTDALSGLLNRKGFDHAIKQILADRPPAGRSHWLVMFDIDHFKRVNDTHGHPVGDTVIETLGSVLKRATDRTDAHAARVGGEEFAVLMRASTSKEALQLAEAVRRLVSATRIRKRGTQEVIASVTVSAGLAAWTPGDDLSSWISAADAALYRAKEGGRDRVSVA
jgi:diguanylate cyclase